MVFALVLGVIGLAGWGVASLSPSSNDPAKAAPAERTVVQPGGSSSYVSGTAPDASTTSVDQEITKLKESWTAWFSRHGAKLGFGFAGGFAIGFAFRTFIKTMASLTAIAVVVFGLLSYFKILNIDLSSVQKAWESNSDWILTQAGKLKDVAMSHLPSSTTGFAGMFMGMKRKS